MTENNTSEKNDAWEQSVKNRNTLEAVFIIDKSGSMSGLEGDTIGGFNSTLEKQRREPGETIVSTVLFDTRFEVLHDRVPIADVPKMTEKDYLAGGSTALCDAVGNSIQHIRSVHQGLGDKAPGKTMFIIITDGFENASREFSRQKVRKMIEKQKEEGWEFLFLGANMDAEEEAASFGIDGDMAVSYTCSDEGILDAYRVMNRAMKCSRRSARFDKSSLDEDD